MAKASANSVVLPHNDIKALPPLSSEAASSRRAIRWSLWRLMIRQDAYSGSSLSYREVVVMREQTHFVGLGWWHWKVLRRQLSR